jgi:hypothetical protein
MRVPGRIIGASREGDDMNGDSRSHQRPGLRRVVAAAVVAGIALLAAACGGGSSASSAGMPSLSTITNQALAYAKCMRSRGIANFPDPTVQDSATSKGVGFSMSGIDQNSPQFRSAAKTCQKQTGFGHITAAQVQAGMNAALKFSECMRSHGITSFPDPVEHGGNIQIGPGPGSGIDLHSAQFKAANKACQLLMPGGGP